MSKPKIAVDNTAQTLALWDSVEKTDPAHTKNFNRGGGFSGTSINATYLAKKATEQFGPMGSGWGVDVVNEDFIEGHIINQDTGEKVIIHRLQISLWYELDGKRGTVTHMGQTTFVGKNKNGLFTDEEAPKKSLTDATTKALSMLGFGGDIFMGMYDDQEYRQEVTDQSLMEKADDKDAEAARIAKEYKEWRSSHFDLVSTATNRGELRTLHTMMTRKMARHNDQAGLRKLEELKDSSLERITTKEEERKNDKPA